MTDRINLDDVDIDESSDADDEANEGDWFWRGEGDPPELEQTADEAADDGSTTAESSGARTGEAAEESDATERRLPRVPRENADKPVGIPTELGGAGGAGGGSAPRKEGASASRENGESTPGAESGPHGGGVDDMTMAVTYGAIRRLADPRAAMADASRWADWIGIVGDVDAHVIHTFQRRNGIDADFFNGTGTGPGERLAEIGPRSMFYAERMVVVGVEDEDERVADAAGWEFVPLAGAAAKAGWELAE